MNNFNLYKDINNLSHLTSVDYSTRKDPYKYMNYNLAHEIPYPCNFKGIYALETKKPDLHYYPQILRPPNTYYDGKSSQLLKDLNNKQVNVSGNMYNINDIPLRPYTSQRQY